MYLLKIFVNNCMENEIKKAPDPLDDPRINKYLGIRKNSPNKSQDKKFSSVGEIFKDSNPFAPREILVEKEGYQIFDAMNFCIDEDEKNPLTL